MGGPEGAFPPTPGLIPAALTARGDVAGCAVSEDEEHRQKESRNQATLSPADRA